MDRVDELAKKIWNYMLLGHELEKVEVILVLGSHDTKVAEVGAGLYLDGYAPFIVFSGNRGKLTEELWEKSEAKVFAEIATTLGVPEDKIILEERATNTGENILFSAEVLKKNNLNPNSFILVTKPYMERRVYVTFQKHFPDKRCIVVSPAMDFTFDSYMELESDKKEIVSVLVGDLIRIKEYPKRGFQIEQQIPEDIWQAGQELIKMGYDKYALI